ncbi:MAG: TetR family transcriptional regulator C-terminal domain-containing protein [Methylococcales bacterium]|nr:TetR family transcriptional regulator C-terminal domain-containing protein [Methylococcales bacterium]
MNESISKQIKREKLLEQGVNLIMTQGYHGTGLKEILDNVNIPKGSFYHYFENKEVFGSEVIKYYIAPFITQLQAHIDDDRYDTLSALTFYFDELIRLSRQENFKGGCLLGNLMGEIGDSSEICRLALKSAVEDYRDLLEYGLNKAQKQGTIRPDKTAKRMADLLVDSWQGALLRMKIEQSTTPLARCCDDLLHDYFKVNPRQ